MKAFITGSRAYGKPNSKSDIDLVIQCDINTAALLRQESESKQTIRFGRLNIIVAGDDTEMAVWKMGTAALQHESPRTFDKKSAHDRFEGLRGMVGMEYDDSSGGCGDGDQ